MTQHKVTARHQKDKYIIDYKVTDNGTITLVRRYRTFAAAMNRMDALFSELFISECRMLLADGRPAIRRFRSV